MSIGGSQSSESKVPVVMGTALPSSAPPNRYGPLKNLKEAFWGIPNWQIRKFPADAAQSGLPAIPTTATLVAAVMEVRVIRPVSPMLKTIGAAYLVDIATLSIDQMVADRIHICCPVRNCGSPKPSVTGTFSA